MVTQNRIASPAEQALSTHAGTHARRVDVIETDHVVFLRGWVRCYYHKQLAQQAVLPVAAGKRVVNELVVDAAS